MTEKKYKEILLALKEIIAGTQWENHVFSVGGCVRDSIVGREIKDIDLVVNEFENGGILFAMWLYENGYLTREPVVYQNFGTAMFHLKKFPQVELEAVQTRKECYRDAFSRNPETSHGTLEDDCIRRDFTYNALYYNISAEKIFDLNGHSLEDLANNVLRTCGDPDVIFTEDALRILRACRFQSRFDSKIEERTLKGMKDFSYKLNIISKERIQEEFNKMMTSKNPHGAMELLIEIDAWPYIFGCDGPEDLSMVSTLPKVLKGLKEIDWVDNSNLEVVLAVVYSHFSHPERRMRRLKYSNEIIKKVMFYLELMDEINFLNCTPKNLRKLQRMAKSYDNLKNACAVTAASLLCVNLTVKKIEKILNDTFEMMASGTAMFNFELPVNGDDVMEIKDIPPSEKVKFYLDFLMDIAYVNPFITYEECEKILKCN